MFNSKFTVKLILITIIPILIFSTVILTLNINQVNNLSSSTALITKNGLEEIYKSHLEKRSNDISGKVSLRIENIKNELNILRGSAQKLIDTKELQAYGEKIQEVPYLKNEFEYNKEKHWSNLKKKDIDISMSTWGYLHEKNGKINKETINYTTLMSPIKPLMSAIGDYGIEKSWLYLTGSKQTPVMIMTPWAQMPAIFDKKYPGHNTNNWWDFFFPGIIEGWERWLSNPTLKPKNISNEVTLTPLYDDAGGTGLMVTFFAPLWNKDRTKNEGAAALDYHVKNISTLVEEETIAKTGFSFLMQSNGNVLGIKEQWAEILGLKKEEKVKKGIVTKVYYKLGESTITDIKPLVEKISKNDFSVYNIKDNNGKEYFIAFKNVIKFNLWTGNGYEIKEDSLYLGMIVPKDEVLEVYYQINEKLDTLSEETISSIIIVSIFLIVTAITLIILFTLKETRQIRMLSDGAKSVRNKKYSTSVPIISKNELGDLTKTFNGMIKEIQSSYSKLENYTQELEEKVKERTKHLKEANNRLEKISITDALTNIYNRRHFNEIFPKVINSAKRKDELVSFLIMDIDHFKQYNDTYGHQMGDDVLTKVSGAIKDSLHRADDYCFRLGGEEFGIIFKADTKEKAFDFANKVRINIENLHIEHTGNSASSYVTASMGLVCKNATEIKDEDEVYKQGDDLLYKAKESGRNKVEFV